MTWLKRQGLAMSLALAVLAATAVFGDAPPAAPGKIKILLIGDSTVAEYAYAPGREDGMTGWGQVFGALFDEQVQVVNRAAGGRSSKSFIQEGKWTAALKEQPDYVFIQFGHNDCPGKGDRTTDPAGDYRDYLRQYIREARAQRARPVLVTPVARRTFRDEDLIDTLRPYAEAMIAVAQAEKVPVIDLHQASSQLYRQLGEDGSQFLTVSRTDRTHFTRHGAETMAGLVADRLPEAVPELAARLRREE